MELLNYASSSEIIGQRVRDSLGHDYGILKDILFSPRHKKALIAIIAVEDGGNISIPFQALSINPNTHHIRVDIDKQSISNAPATDMDRLQEGNKEELDKIYTYYGYEHAQGLEEQEAPPVHQPYKSGENTGERHPENMGSYQESQQAPGSIGGQDAKFEEETDYDKIKGLPKDKDKE